MLFIHSNILLVAIFVFIFLVALIASMIFTSLDGLPIFCSVLFILSVLFLAVLVSFRHELQASHLQDLQTRIQEYEIVIEKHKDEKIDALREDVESLRKVYELETSLMDGKYWKAWNAVCEANNLKE